MAAKIAPQWNLLSCPAVLRTELVRQSFALGGLARQSPISRTAPSGGSILRSAHNYHRPTTSSPLLLLPPSSHQQRYQSTVSDPSTTTTAPQTPPPTSEPPQPRRLRRFLTTTALTLLFFTTGFAMSAAPAADTVNGFMNPPSDAETLNLFVPPTPSAEEINTRIISSPLAVSLRSKAEWTESRPHLKIPESMRPYNLTGGTLMGDEKIAVPPLNFATKEAELPEMVSISYLGPALCGHPGIVHGGLLATMLDEGLARACFPALPNKVGVTASLKIDYRVPCPAKSFVVLRAQTTKVEGRKAWVKGWIELLGEGEGEGTKLVEAEALFIEPKGAAQMARVYSSQ
ncbi:hypothetical protein MBLNU230_g3753t1 [Neophaeotheca triangularis]